MKEKILNKLFELQDLKYKEFHSGLCPNVDNIIGVRVPVLRNYAKELLKQYTLDELLNNINDNYYEEIMLQGMLIGLNKNKNIDEVFNYIREFVPKIDNWAVCDVFCAGLKITKNNKEKMWNFINKYLKSEDEFKLRFAIVMILDFYIDEDYIDRDLEIFNNISSDKYYVQMAVAWAISVCLIKFYDKTKIYLQGNMCDLDDFTFNKSIQKAIESYRITEDKKNELRAMKK